MLLKAAGINLAVLALSALLLMPTFPVDEGRQDYLESLYNELPSTEGTGDYVTDVPTGFMGVTQAARDAVRAPPEVPDRRVALMYLNHLDKLWEAQEGYSDAPPEVRIALLDASYNLGPGVMAYEGVRVALEGRDWLGVAYNLLDTANVDSKSVKGLAKRRAIAYNIVAEKDLMFVRQYEDGTIAYATVDEVVLSYRPEGGRHEKSQAGFVILAPDPRSVQLH